MYWMCDVLLCLLYRRHFYFHPWAMCHSFAWDHHPEFQFLIRVRCHKECMFLWTWRLEWAFGSHLACKVYNCVILLMMMMMSRFIKRVINSPQTRSLDKPNRWAFRCPANVKGERVAVRRVSGRLFQVTGPTTAKLLIPSVVLVLGTKSSPVPADRRCRLPAIVYESVQNAFASNIVSSNLYFKVRLCDDRWVWPGAWLTCVTWHSQSGRATAGRLWIVHIIITLTVSAAYRSLMW